MRDIYTGKLELLLENYQLLKNDFKREADNTKPLIALNYLMKDKKIATKELKMTYDYMKKKTGILSPLRNQNTFSLCAMLDALSVDPIKEIDFMIENINTVKKVGFKQTNYLPTAMYIISSNYQGNDVEGFACKALDIYKEMKSNHPYLTSGENYALTMLLASKSKNLDILEVYFKGLCDIGFSKSNGLQTLSHILSLTKERTEVQIEKCKRIYDVLKDNKIKVSTNYYAAIGLIALFDISDESVLNELVEIINYLRKAKGFKNLEIGINVLIASALIASEHIKISETDILETSLQTSIESILLAQQIALFNIMISASVAVY